LSEVQDDYDVFVCYDELTSKEYAETVQTALERKGYKVFVAHIRRPFISGDFESVIDNVIQNCKVFLLLLNYETLTRPQIKRETKIAFPNGNISLHDFWIFRVKASDVERGSTDFYQETQIDLNSQNQSDFSIQGQLAADVLRKCNEKRRLEALQQVTAFPPEQSISEEALIKKFAAKYKEEGYTAEIQSKIKSQFYVDLVLRKENELILCEFKKNVALVTPQSFRQLLTFKSEIENIVPETKLQLWIITQGIFDRKVKLLADYYNVKLFDDSNLEPSKISISTDRTVYPLEAVIHLRIKPDIVHPKIPFEIEITDSKQKIIQKLNVLPFSEKKIYELDIILSRKKWDIGNYLVKVKHDISEAIDSFRIEERHSIIELDQRVYTWTDQVIITVISPDHDKDNQIADIIGNRPDAKITIKTSKGELSNYILKETGLSTGIFQGIVTLTGFSGHISEKISIPSHFGMTKDDGPYNGLISCSNEDFLKIIFETKNEKVVANALIRWNIGEIQWLKPSYTLGDKAIVRVIDPDMNFNPNEIDKFLIHVWSDSDSEGINLEVKETSKNSAIFEGSIKLGTNLDENNLKVSPGDTITAEYVDFTLPDPYGIHDKLTILSTAKIL